MRILSDVGRAIGSPAGREPVEQPAGWVLDSSSRIFDRGARAGAAMLGRGADVEGVERVSGVPLLVLLLVGAGDSTARGRHRRPRPGRRGRDR